MGGAHCFSLFVLEMATSSAACTCVKHSGASFINQPVRGACEILRVIYLCCTCFLRSGCGVSQEQASALVRGDVWAVSGGRCNLREYVLVCARNYAGSWL